MILIIDIDYYAITLIIDIAINYYAINIFDYAIIIIDTPLLSFSFITLLIDSHYIITLMPLLTLDIDY
jgi:hypothetical protein